MFYFLSEREVINYGPVSDCVCVCVCVCLSHTGIVTKQLHPLHFN